MNNIRIIGAQDLTGTQSLITVKIVVLAYFSEYNIHNKIKGQVLGNVTMNCCPALKKEYNLILIYLFNKITFDSF